MSESVIVVVADLDDAKHGEINVVESLPKAARLVETLLEAGFDQTRVRVFSGEELDMRVRHRPVVALVTGDQPADQPHEMTDHTEKATATAAAKAESRKQEAEAAPYERNGVRFSTAFRPA
jgi:antitoxin (DNA-binding transcriptional repressor) of toxin-antitoxin stability system